MCNPGMLLGAQAFGAGMSTVGAVFGAMSQKSSLKHAAAMAEINARVAEGNARNMIRAGVVEESRIKMEGSRAKSATIARIGSSGVDLSSPVAQARLTGTDLVTAVDAQTLRGNALRAAWGQRFEAQDQRSRANSLRASASTISPVLAGVTSLAGSVGQVASSWYSMDTQGAFDKGVSGSFGGFRGVDAGAADGQINSRMVAPSMWPEYTQPRPSTAFSSAFRGY